MSEGFNDRLHQEPDFTSWWCIMANIIRDGARSESAEDGTKHFLEGETVACLSFYPNDNERVVVLGRHRETRRYDEALHRDRDKSQVAHQLPHRVDGAPCRHQPPAQVQEHQERVDC